MVDTHLPTENLESTLRVDDKGTQFWHDPEGRLHRLDGPAIEWVNGDREWWVRGRLHRLDGPAVERVDGRQGWWVDGREYADESDFLRRALPECVLDRPLTPHEIALAQDGAGYIRGRVAVTIADLINGDIGGILAEISMRLTGSARMDDVSLRAVAVTGDGRVVVEVRGNPARLLESAY